MLDIVIQERGDFMRLTPMLGENLKNYPDSVLDNKTWRVSEKVDGVRRLFYKNNSGEVTAWSRTNKQDIWSTHIMEYFEAPWFPTDTVYDCELVDRELYFSNVESFILRSTSNAKASQQYAANKKDLMAVCFDIFKPDGDLRTGKERDAELYSLFNGTSPDAPVVRVPVYGTIVGADIERINAIMKSVKEKGGEGLMLMDMDSPYIFGRSRSLLKVKRMEEFTGRVVDVVMAREGTKIEGGVAAIICEVDGCTIPVQVGSGFSNEERYDMVENSPVGRTVEIDAFSYSRDRNGCISLNLPIFKQFK